MTSALSIFRIGSGSPRPPVALAERMQYHLREEQGRSEVDLLIETAGGQLIGIEIKAAATVTTTDARHLAWLRGAGGHTLVIAV